MNKEFIIAGVYFSRHEAEMAKGLLDDAGIWSVVSGDDCGGMRPDIALGMGNFKVTVNANDLDNARAALAVLKHGDENRMEHMDIQRKKSGFGLGFVFFLCFLVFTGFMCGRRDRGIDLPDIPTSCKTLEKEPVKKEVCREFYRDGTVFSETYYRNEQANGPAKEYWNDGTLAWEGNYTDGYLDGEVREFYRNGKIKQEFVYQKDVIIQVKGFDQEGRLIVDHEE